MTTEIEQFTQEMGYIEEALRFVGQEWEDIDMKIKDGAVRYEIKLTGVEYKISGLHVVGDQNNARVSVIMTISLARHIYGQLVFDTLAMAEKAMHNNPQRNTVPEIAIRFMIKQYLRKGVLPNRLKDTILDALHVKQNITEETLFFAAMQHSPKKN